MKALVLVDYTRLSYEEVPDPTYGPHDVLIEVKKVGICGSDVHGADGSSGRRIPPIIMGHEASGVIKAIGEKVGGYNVGDRVTFDSTIYCGECEFCKTGFQNLCNNRKVIGVSCADYIQQGAMAEFVVVPARILYHLPSAVSYEHAAMIEPLSVALHAVKQAKIQVGDKVVVIGAGLIGLFITQLLKISGCSEIIVSDLSEERLKIAQLHGATSIVNSKTEDLEKFVMRASDSKGVDVTFEAVGIAATFNRAVKLARKGGKVVLVGNLSNSVELDLQHIVVNEKQLITSCASAGEYSLAISMIQKGMISFDGLISTIVPLKEGEKQIKKLLSGDETLLKVLLEP